MDDKRAIKIMNYIGRVRSNKDPVSIQAGITDFCLNACHMCGHHLRDNKANIDADEWINFLKKRCGIESVCYSGGDPILHPAFNKIMDYHCKTGKAFGMITAGFIPSTIDLSLLKKARWVRVSLDSVVDSDYKNCRGGISVDKIINSIINAKNYGINIELTITVSEYSSNNIGELFKFAIANKMNSDIHPVYGSTFKELGIAEEVYNAKNDFDSAGLVFAPYLYGDSNFKKCYAPYYQLFIDAFGDIYPCCTLAGDTKKAPEIPSLGNISSWQHFLTNRHSFVKNFKKERDCRTCVARFYEMNEVVEQSLEINSRDNFF